MTIAPPTCSRCHRPMPLRSRFVMAEEPGDSAETRRQLRFLAGLGLELGAAVVLYYCEPCDIAQTLVDYPPQPAP